MTRGPPGPLCVNRSTPNSAAVLCRQISTDLRRRQHPRPLAQIEALHTARSAASTTESQYHLWPVTLAMHIARRSGLPITAQCADSPKTTARHSARESAPTIVAHFDESPDACPDDDKRRHRSAPNDLSSTNLLASFQGVVPGAEW